MAKSGGLKNIFNNLPNIETIKDDLQKYINYHKLSKSSDTKPEDLEKTKPTLFNLKGKFKFPQKSYSSSPLKIDFVADVKSGDLVITVKAKLNKSAPEYSGSDKERIQTFLKNSFDYTDFYRIIERCIAGFKTKDPESIEEILTKGGVSSIDEFIEQISVTPEFKEFINNDNKNETIKDIEDAIDEMIRSPKYGLKYFVSKLVSKNSPDGFEYSDIANDVINFIMNKK